MLPFTSVPSFEKWKAACVEEIIRAVETYSKDDAQPLVNLIPNLAPQIYFEWLIAPLIATYVVLTQTVSFQH